MKKLVAVAALLALLPVAIAVVVSGPIDAQESASELARTEIPPDLLPVYVAASDTCPGLPWQVLAAIGYVESRHGQGRADPVTGQVAPPIIGPAIDGRPGFAAIRDPSSPDGWAHAVGPMQFLTTTFQAWGIVAPNRPPNAEPDPNNAWDAIYSAARYLCAGTNRLDNIHDAVLRYNHSEGYVQVVLAKAFAYASPPGISAAASSPEAPSRISPVSSTLRLTPAEPDDRTRAGPLVQPGVGP